MVENQYEQLSMNFDEDSISTAMIDGLITENDLILFGKRRKKLVSECYNEEKGV